MYLEFQNKYYIFQKPIFRAEFFQAAIIPSFRDPNTQLKISKWSWYGKLMKNLVEISNYLSDEINNNIVSDK